MRLRRRYPVPVSPPVGYWPPIPETPPAPDVEAALRWRQGDVVAMLVLLGCLAVGVLISLLPG